MDKTIVKLLGVLGLGGATAFVFCKVFKLPILLLTITLMLVWLTPSCERIVTRMQNRKVYGLTSQLSYAKQALVIAKQDAEASKTTLQESNTKLEGRAQEMKSLQFIQAAHLSSLEKQSATIEGLRAEVRELTEKRTAAYVTDSSVELCKVAKGEYSRWIGASQLYAAEQAARDVKRLCH